MRDGAEANPVSSGTWYFLMFARAGLTFGPQSPDSSITSGHSSNLGMAGTASAPADPPLIAQISSAITRYPRAWKAAASADLPLLDAPAKSTAPFGVSIALACRGKRPR